MLDPTPFAAFGVLGGLLFAVAIMCGLVWRLFSKQSEMFQKSAEHNQTQQKVLMDWVDTHRRETNIAIKETHTAMHDVAATVSHSHDKLGTTLSHSLDELKHVISALHQRTNEFMLNGLVVDKMRDTRRKGDPLDETLITKIEQTVRAVMTERNIK